jgi:hypothetical protein
MGKKKGFNEYTIRGNVVEISIYKGTKKFIVKVSKKHLKRLLNLDQHWHMFWNWSNNKYYAKCTIQLGTDNGKQKSKPLQLGRFITECYDYNYIIDHINNDTLDYTDENLRITTDKFNLMNRSGENKNNTSGYRNVSWINGHWRVQLQVDGKNKLFPEKFEDVHDAGEFAKKMREKYYGEFAGKSRKHE